MARRRNSKNTYLSENAIMKKIGLLLALLISFGFATSFAQGVVVRLGDIPANKTADGKISTAYTTCDRIVKDGKLVTTETGDEIISYLFSVAIGTDMWGPFEGKGPQLSDKMISRLKETKGPGVKVFFDDIKVKRSGVVRMALPLSFKYNQ